MRKKIGKRIGPVPITLAVFALAAVLSVGLLLTLSGSVIQAQGLPKDDPSPSHDQRCEVNVVIADGTTQPVYVAGGGCTTSDDTLEVMFKNPSTGNGAGDEFVAVYVTGGDDFTNLQAADDDGTDLGKEGIDEHLLTIGKSSTGLLGKTQAGVKSVTVERGMAQGGKVYLFAYVADDMDNTFNDGDTAW